MSTLSSRRATFGLVAVLSVLAGCAGSASPPSARPALAAGEDHDVIVVGAGLAGLTTAKEVMRSGHTVLVREATDRIGGRAVTDQGFSVPIDLGAAWLHGADLNPLTALVDWRGFRREPSRLDGPVFVGSRRLPPG